MAITSEEKIRRLEEKRAKIKADIQKERAKVSKENRKIDTRKKILIGSMIQSKVKSGEWPEAKLKQAMDKYLEKESDRKLFEL